MVPCCRCATEATTVAQIPICELRPALQKTPPLRPKARSKTAQPAGILYEKKT
jgi:hypothetical protein